MGEKIESRGSVQGIPVPSGMCRSVRSKYNDCSAGTITVTAENVYGGIIKGNNALDNAKVPETGWYPSASIKAAEDFGIGEDKDAEKG